MRINYLPCPGKKRGLYSSQKSGFTSRELWCAARCLWTCGYSCAVKIRFAERYFLVASISRRDILSVEIRFNKGCALVRRAAFFFCAQQNRRARHHQSNSLWQSRERRLFLCSHYAPRLRDVRPGMVRAVPFGVRCCVRRCRRTLESGTNALAVRHRRGCWVRVNHSTTADTEEYSLPPERVPASSPWKIAISIFRAVQPSTSPTAEGRTSSNCFPNGKSATFLMRRLRKVSASSTARPPR